MQPRETTRRRRDLDPDAAATGRALAVVIGFAVVSIVAVVLVFALRGRPAADPANAPAAGGPALVEQRDDTDSGAPDPAPAAPDGATLVQLVRSGDRAALAAALQAVAPAVVNGAAGGMTPLMQASSQGDVEMVELLLAHGADPNARGSSRRTALQYAAERNHAEVARRLLDAGADIDGYDDTRLTPLVMAADRNYTELALLFLERGAAVDIVHVQGWTALIDAARHGNDELVRALLAAGADADIRLPGGQSARDLAEGNGHRGVVRLLDAHARRAVTGPAAAITPSAATTGRSTAATVTSALPAAADAPPEPRPATPSPTAAATPALAPQLAVLLLTGRYAPRLGDVLDASQAVRLVAVDGGLRWSAGDGVFWRLTPTADPSRLAVGADCPWYEAGHREVRVEWDGDGAVRRVSGPLDTWYERVGD
ncbi:MAG: ankyrin repeat domain-containing protein [Gammaproteobacteria bacterium]